MDGLIYLFYFLSGYFSPYALYSSFFNKRSTYAKISYNIRYTLNCKFMPPVLNKSELFIFDGEMFTFMTWNSRNLNLLKCHCLNMASNKSNKKYIILDYFNHQR